MRRLMVTVALAAAVALCASGCSDESKASPARPTATASSVAPADKPVVMVKSAPVRVRIPAIKVDSALIRLGLQDDKTLEVPQGAFPAGWYTGAPTPGELGPAIIAGHVHWNERDGVFENLGDLRPDDQVIVTRRTGRPAVFRVTLVEQVAKDEFPTKAVYGNIDHAGLRLITCGGYDKKAREYEDNVVVFAELVGPAPRA